MVKKVRFLVLLALIFSLSTTVFAAGPQANVSTETVYFDDGSYMQITTTVQAGFARSSTIEVTRDYDYYLAGKRTVGYSLTGTFRYDGTTSEATDASAVMHIYESGWGLDSHSEDYSGNRVTGTATFSGPNNRSKTLNGSITCDKNGNIT